MNKYLNKNRYIVLLIALFALISYMPKVEAKTLRQLKEELSAKQSEYEASKNQKKLTENEIANKRASVNAINDEISSISQEMLDLTAEIDKLNIEIEEKEKEIKDIMNYYQLSNGESAYLEYIFDAADYTDFIYRLAISEQLSSYNKALIKEYNNTIKANERKKEELKNKTVSLNEKQKELEKELVSLKDQLGSIVEETVSIEDELKSIRETINTYESTYKCGLDEDLSVCGRDKLPPGTAFFRPVVSGSISANFGWYSPFGNSTWHYGIDFAGTGHGANVYSIANGKVAAIMYKNSCGGNMVFIQHLVNGQKYTSLYAHLAGVNVRVGDTVTYNSVIGWVGGNPYIETWDGCSTGTHLHLQTAYGWYMGDYYYYSIFTSNSFDPRFIVNLPAKGQWFSNRNTRY